MGIGEYRRAKLCEQRLSQMCQERRLILYSNYSIERRSKQMQKLGKPNTG